MKWLSVKWLTIYAVVYMIFLYAPVILLPLFAFNTSTIIAFPCRASPPNGSWGCGIPTRCTPRWAIR